MLSSIVFQKQDGDEAGQQNGEDGGCGLYGDGGSGGRLPEAFLLLPTEPPRGPPDLGGDTDFPPAHTHSTGSGAHKVVKSQLSVSLVSDHGAYRARLQPVSK